MKTDKGFGQTARQVSRSDGEQFQTSRLADGLQDLQLSLADVQISVHIEVNPTGPRLDRRYIYTQREPNGGIPCKPCFNAQEPRTLLGKWMIPYRTQQDNDIGGGPGLPDESDLLGAVLGAQFFREKVRSLG